MTRHALLTTCTLLLAAAPVCADSFDHYTNSVLTRVPGAGGVQEVKRLTPDLITEHDRVLPQVSGAVVVVRTNEGRYSKLLVQSAAQRVGPDRTVPILYVERYVTYRQGEERAVEASGRRLSLFPGFRLSLDLGQVVPEQLGGDLRFVVEGKKAYAEPVGKAKLYLLTKPLPEAAPKKGGKFILGPTFEPRYFTGTFKLHDDGRRSGTLKLEVAKDGSVRGAYYSDRDGRRYEVMGKAGTPVPHAIQFRIKFPRSVQTFQGWMFTGDGRAFTGASRMLRQEFGFYALRVEE